MTRTPLLLVYFLAFVCCDALSGEKHLVLSQVPSFSLPCDHFSLLSLRTAEGRMAYYWQLLNRVACIKRRWAGEGPKKPMKTKERRGRAKVNGVKEIQGRNESGSVLD